MLTVIVAATATAAAPMAMGRQRRPSLERMVLVGDALMGTGLPLSVCRPHRVVTEPDTPGKALSYAESYGLP